MARILKTMSFFGARRFIGLIALGVLLSSGPSCSGLLYHPTRVRHIDPAKVGADPEEVFFDNETGQKLHGWYLRATTQGKPKGQVVFFHGNGENLSTHFIALLWLRDEGYNYFIFDYQGYGLSVGKPSPEGTIVDGKAAVRWAARKHPELPLAIFGQSLGGAVALRTAAEIKGEVPIKLITVDSTFRSYKQAARGVLRKHWLTWPLQPLTWFVLSDKWAPEDHIRELSPIPVIVMHGTEDQVIDYGLGEDVFAEAGDPKEFWKVEGGHHIDGFWNHAEETRPKYLAALNRWVAAKTSPVVAEGAPVKLARPCTLRFPRAEEGYCEAELCGRLDRVAQRDFDVFEKADSTSRRIFTLKTGDVLDQEPTSVLIVDAPGIIRVYDSDEAAEKKDTTRGKAHAYLNYEELGTYRACDGRKTFTVGEMEANLVDLLKPAKSRQWLRVKYKGKTGYVMRPENSGDGLEIFGLPAKSK